MYWLFQKTWLQITSRSSPIAGKIIRRSDRSYGSQVNRTATRCKAIK